MVQTENNELSTFAKSPYSLDIVLGKKLDYCLKSIDENYIA